jgi:hypothetical protein
MSIKNNAHPMIATAALVVSLAGAADASLLVYEGFQYETGAATRAGADLLDGQADDAPATDTLATGLGGTWTDTLSPNAVGNLFIGENSLAFGDLATSGNHVRSDTNSNNDNYTRSITAGLNSGSELWFSVLANKLQNNFSAAEGGLVIGNQQVNNTRVLLDTGTTGLQGFGIAPTTAGNNWTAYGWNGSSQVVGGANLTVATDGSETNLLVGKVEFDAGGGGEDIYTLYQYQLNAGSIAGGTLNEITSILVDVNQSTLDTLSLTRQVNTAYDEIRIGTTLNDVIPVPEPGSLALLGLGGLLMLRRSSAQVARRRRS